MQILNLLLCMLEFEFGFPLIPAIFGSDLSTFLYKSNHVLFYSTKFDTFFDSLLFKLPLGDPDLLAQNLILLFIQTTRTSRIDYQILILKFKSVLAVYIENSNEMHFFTQNIEQILLNVESDIECAVEQLYFPMDIYLLDLPSNRLYLLE